MRNVARISYTGGGLLLPALAPYEQQLVFEHAPMPWRPKGSSSIFFAWDGKVDPGYKFAGLISFCRYLLRKRGGH